MSGNIELIRYPTPEQIQERKFERMEQQILTVMRKRWINDLIIRFKMPNTLNEHQKWKPTKEMIFERINKCCSDADRRMLLELKPFVREKVTTDFSHIAIIDDNTINAILIMLFYALNLSEQSEESIHNMNGVLVDVFDEDKGKQALDIIMKISSDNDQQSKHIRRTMLGLVGGRRRKTRRRRRTRRTRKKRRKRRTRRRRRRRTR